MKLAVLTTGRQDWGILRSTCELLRSDPGFELRLLVGGMHHSPRHGQTARLIAAEGFADIEPLRWDTEADVAVQAAAALAQTAEVLQRRRADALVVVGDRFETAAAALAATVTRVPLVHLHGGEQTEGAFDDALRHAVTKLSHLHLVSHADYARRVIALGEDPVTVHVVGAPGLDNLRRADLPSRAELESHLGLKLEPPVIVVTLHPTTLGADPRIEAEALAAAMDRVAATYVVTLPNNDPGNEVVRATLLRAAAAPRRRAVEALGERLFFGLLRCADAVAGNSSSGLIEAPALGLSVVNIGDRQKGRIRTEHIIDVAGDAEAIAQALTAAVDPARRPALAQVAAPFGEGRAGDRKSVV